MRRSLAIKKPMFAHKFQTVSATLLASFALSLAACGDDAGPSSPGTGGAPPSGGTGGQTGGQSGSTGGSFATGGIPGSGGAFGGSSSGGAGAATGGATGGSSGGTNAGAAGSIGSGGTAGASAGAGGERTGGAGGASGGAGGKASTGGAATGGTAGAAGGGAGGKASTGGAAGSTSGGSGGGAGASSYQPCPATGACKIMPFGDSITQGYNVAGGYRAPLFHLALAGNKNITFVGSASDYSVPTVDGMTFPKNHEGHGGYTIEGNNGIAQYVNTSVPNYKPNIITLMIGTNDINGNNNVADAPNRLGKLLDSIFTKDANVLVVLAQIVPTTNDGTNNTIKTYNAAMPNLVSTRVGQGRHIVLVDMYGAFTKNTSYKTALMGDNLHPNQTGYNLMADVWFQALTPYLR